MRRLTEDFFYYWAGPDNPNDQNNQFLLWDCEQTGALPGDVRLRHGQALLSIIILVCVDSFMSFTLNKCVKLSDNCFRLKSKVSLGSVCVFRNGRAGRDIYTSGS